MRGWFQDHLEVFLQSSILHLAIIVILGLLCYSNTFSVPFYFDDYGEFINRMLETDPWDVLVHAGARRFADFTLILNYRVHGLDVAGYHAVNLAIHLGSAVALYFLCVAVLQSLDVPASETATGTSLPSQTVNRFIPLAASLLFVCHPLQTQAVTYIIQRYTSLVGLFYLLTMLAYVKARICVELHGFKKDAAVWGIFGALSAVLGFYTKQSIYSLPLMIVLFELCLFRGRFVKRILSILVAGGMVLIGIKVFVSLHNGGTLSDVTSYLRHATSEDLSTSRFAYFVTQLRVIVTYLRLLIVPVDQRLDYDYPEFTSLLSVEVLASLALHILLVSSAVVLYLKSCKRDPAAHDNQRHLFRLTSLGIAWFYIALSVTSSFIPIPDDIAEHRMYLPSAGLFIALSAIAYYYAQKVKNGTRYATIGLTLVCLVLGIATISRNNVWRDEVGFWKNEVRLSPRNGLVYGNLGFAYQRQDKYESALLMFVNALKLDPTLRTVWIGLGSTLQELGRYQGRFSTGEEYLTPERDIDYRFYNLFYSNAFNVMGLTHELIGSPEEALKWYTKSLALNPASDSAWYNFALLSLRLGSAGQVNIAAKKLKELNSQFLAELERNKTEEGE